MQMNIFDKLVSVAIQNSPRNSSLRIVVEKELLHHDILRIMRDHSFISKLTFIGGTCLRYCYEGQRLSEDLYFTGGLDFSKQDLKSMGTVISKTLGKKYGLKVTVSEPIKDKTNVDTWKIKVITRPESKNLPAQHIHIDICAVTSYDIRPVMLRNPYNVEMGTGGLIINAQSQEEILSDKLLAFALRPNRIKYRDLWDILWLHKKSVKPKFDLLPLKVEERGKSYESFLKSFHERKSLLNEKEKIFHEFQQEMFRFLPKKELLDIVNQSLFWNFLTKLFDDFEEALKRNS